MIPTPTTFVLGAGAHCSYGFPNGRDLKKECVERIRESVGKANDASFLLLAEYAFASGEDVEAEKCLLFADALEKSGWGSIDAFLNANRHRAGFEAIGKGAVAQVLLEYEEKHSDSPDDDWLTYLLDVMLDGIRSPQEFIENNDVGFVTFNYDRLLEMWLLDKIKHSFGLSETQAVEVLEEIPIFHVYGTLGPYPVAELPVPRGWIDASRNIRTIFDAPQDEADLKNAKDLIAHSETTCFLGFAFHRENVDLLDLVGLLLNVSTVASSRFQITEHEWQRRMQPFEQAEVQVEKAAAQFKCREAMRNLPIF